MARGRHRDRLLEEGMCLLARNGFAATGVQEIAAASGVPKGSFYNYFASKDAFAAEVLERYGAGACGALERAFAASPGGPLAQLREVLASSGREAAAGDFAGGCIAGRLAQELAGEHPEFRGPLAAVFGGIRDQLTRQLVRAQSVGELDPSLAAESLADFVLSIWQGAMLRAKALGRVDPLDLALEVLFSRVLIPAPGQLPAPVAGTTDADGVGRSKVSPAT